MFLCGFNKTFCGPVRPALPAGVKGSIVGVALVQLLQHVLALAVGEGEAEGEVGGGTSGL